MFHLFKKPDLVHISVHSWQPHRITRNCKANKVTTLNFVTEHLTKTMISQWELVVTSFARKTVSLNCMFWFIFVCSLLSSNFFYGNRRQSKFFFSEYKNSYSSFLTGLSFGIMALNWPCVALVSHWKLQMGLTECKIGTQRVLGWTLRG